MSRLAALLALAAALPCLPVAGWEWPVEGPTVTATFAQPVAGLVMPGMELASSGRAVTAVQAGVVVYSRDEGEEPPSGLGSYIVVEHDSGFRSVYAHLEPGSTLPAGTAVEAGQQIGLIGQSGPVETRTLRLFVIDTRSGSYVNPLLLLPDLPDTVRPSIETVFASAEGAYYDLAGRTELPVGTYRLHAVAHDRTSTARTAARLAPYRVSLLVDGTGRYLQTADRLDVVDGAAILRPGDTPRDAIVSASGTIDLGEVVVTATTVDLVLAVRDFAGNEVTLRIVLRGTEEP